MKQDFDTYRSFVRMNGAWKHVDRQINYIKLWNVLSFLMDLALAIGLVYVIADIRSR